LLLYALDLVAVVPVSWDEGNSDGGVRVRETREGEIAGYLTGIVKSGLDWLEGEERERVWEGASVRLCERAGRMGWCPKLKLRIHNILLTRGA
jgi:hypothetical protein